MKMIVVDFGYNDYFAIPAESLQLLRYFKPVEPKADSHKTVFVPSSKKITITLDQEVELNPEKKPEPGEVKWVSEIPEDTE